MKMIRLGKKKKTYIRTEKGASYEAQTEQKKKKDTRDKSQEKEV